MTGITVDRLKEIATLADELPEEYRVAAFRELVRHELGTSDGASSPGSNAGGGKSPTPSIPPDDKMPALSAIKKMDGNAKVAWAIIELTRQGEVATGDAIGRLIRVKLGTAPPANMPRTLKAITPDYADREPHGRGFKYVPNSNTMNLLQRNDG